MLPITELCHKWGRARGSEVFCYSARAELEGQQAFLGMVEGEQSKANVPCKHFKAEVKFSAGEY